MMLQSKQRLSNKQIFKFNPDLAAINMKILLVYMGPTWGIKPVAEFSRVVGGKFC